MSPLASVVVVFNLDLAEANNLELRLETPTGERTVLEIDGPGMRQVVFESTEALRFELRSGGSVLAERSIDAFDEEAQP